MADNSGNDPATLPDKHAASGWPKPKIGLALGGGVGRGWAHIGVIKRLLEHGIEPDLVAGTSVGALVGGCYLAGRLETLEDWARSLNRRRMTGYFDFLINGTGIIGGKKLEKVLQRHLGDVMIEDLPRPFTAVTSELATGHEAWLRSGSLVEAIQAAYALPGVFPPRKIMGRWLIDGALVNPLPVSVCRAMGARLVVAVGLHADAFGRAAVSRAERYDDFEFVEGHGLRETGQDEVGKSAMLRQLFGGGEKTPSMGTVMLASLNIVMDRLTRSRLAGDPADVSLLPSIGHIALLDFDKADELIELGAQCVDHQLPFIRNALSVLGKNDDQDVSNSPSS
ncbi:patatin-like phospholipase family protein [Parvularcula sp. IMCC14364]|uniref:patatin-like phospholipase family protein n=1 Tax=Parvularcula sp. IMCC14364 TaxID=3067902 RepID=UPI002740FAC9|nr:patatin-like phospholipase family protein [Parvularcula sp. IMCC14364]